MEESSGDFRGEIAPAGISKYPSDEALPDSRQLAEDPLETLDFGKDWVRRWKLYFQLGNVTRDVRGFSEKSAHGTV
jgi:hypothetical protein